MTKILEEVFKIKHENQDCFVTIEFILHGEENDKVRFFVSKQEKGWFSFEMLLDEFFNLDNFKKEMGKRIEAIRGGKRKEYVRSRILTLEIELEELRAEC